MRDLRAEPENVKLPLLITSYVDIETGLGVSESDFEKGWIAFVNERY